MLQSRNQKLNKEEAIPTPPFSSLPFHPPNAFWALENVSTDIWYERAFESRHELASSTARIYDNIFGSFMWSCFIYYQQPYNEEAIASSCLNVAMALH